MSQAPNTADTQRLLGVLKQAVELVDHRHTNPDAAIVKVAQTNHLLPGELRAVVSAFNNGRQVAQWGEKSATERLAPFPLANYDAIHAELYGTAKAASANFISGNKVSGLDAYTRGPDWLDRPAKFQKSAACVTPAPEPYVSEETRTRLRMTSLHQAKQAESTAQAQYDDAVHQTSIALGRCRIALENHDAPPYQLFKLAAVTYHGHNGRALCEQLEAVLSPYRMKSGSVHSGNLRGTSAWQAAETAIAAAQAAGRYASVLQEKQAALARLQPLPPPAQEPELEPLLSLNKASNWFGGALVGTGMQTVAEPAFSGDTQGAVDSEVGRMNEHEAQLQNIRTQAQIHAALGDENNPLSGYDPDQVMETYQQLAQTAPMTAQQMSTIQPMLLKQLAGRVEPFEIKELTDVEHGLRRLQPGGSTPPPRA